MSNSTSNLDLIRVAQAQKETTANELFDAASPAMLYGRRASTSGGLVWGYYGGAVIIGGTPTSIANGTITLTASATNYLQADPATGAVSKNTTGFTAGMTPLYSVVAGASTVTSYTDFRVGGGGGGGGAVASVNGQTGEVALTAADVGADASGAALAAVSAHVAVADPHPQYLTAAEGNSAYEVAGAVATHTESADPHPQYMTQAEADARYAAGASGVSVSSGASAPFVEKTTSYAATAGDCLLANTSTGAFTITLPASPAANDGVWIVDSRQCFDINNLTIARNGKPIAGMPENLVLNEAGAAIRLVYQDSTVGWVPVQNNAKYIGTRWNPTDAYIGQFLVYPNMRTIVGLNSGASWKSIRSDRSRSAGKYYFEFKIDLWDGSFSPMIGVGRASAPLTGYVGSDGNGWGMTANGQRYAGGASTAQATYATGDIVGVAVDFTAGTGSVAFYKNNAANGAYTSLTVGTLFPMASTNGVAGFPRGTLRTRAEQCTYAPPAGYSYWDA